MNLELSNYVVLTGILIVTGLFLNKWEPPIKKQYVALMLLVTGVALGHFMVDNPAYGFLIAGLVFYKDELVSEIKLVKESVLEVKKEKRICECLLYIEDTIYNTPLLRLNFRYGDQVFSPQPTDGKMRFIFRETQEGRSVIRYFRRTPDIEKEAILLLQNAGLEAISDSHFKLSKNTPEKSINEWVAHHRTMLQESFVLTSGIQDKRYSLDEIRIEQSLDDGPDWFELHITAVIGELRIPFSRFRKHILEDRHEYTLPDGRIILLPEEWFSKYANLM